MKKLILILIMLSLFGFVLQAKIKTGRSWYGLKGNVKSCEEIDSSDNSKRIITFDVNGNEISYVSQTFDEETKAYIVSFSRLSKYNANNNVIQKVETGDDKPVTITCIYNDKNQLIEEQNPGNERKTKYRYDDKGNQIEKLEFDLSAKTASRMAYVYDAAGQMIECEAFSSTGAQDWKNYYKYDDKGNEIEFDRTMKDYEFDEFTGEEIPLEVNTVLRRSEYNEQGLLIKQVTESTDSFISSTSITYAYIFDQIGNWIKKTTLAEGEEPKIQIRIIEYFCFE